MALRFAVRTLVVWLAVTASAVAGGSLLERSNTRESAVATRATAHPPEPRHALLFRLPDDPRQKSARASLEDQASQHAWIALLGVLLGALVFGLATSTIRLPVSIRALPEHTSASFAATRP